MRRFKFKFQKVLEVREHKEKQAQTEFALVFREFKMHEDAINAAQNAKADSYLRSREWIAQGNFDLLRKREMTFQALSAIQNEQKKALELIRPRVDHAREKLNKAMTDRKAMEILKDKAWNKYIKEFEYEETKQLDEIGINMVIRNRENL